MNDPVIIVSPLSQKFSDGNLTVDVEIYRIETSPGWTLELVDEDNNSIVWTDSFATDQAAWDEFASGVQDVGLEALLSPNDGAVETIH